MLTAFSKKRLRTEENKEEEYTFQPQINEASKAIVDRLRPKDQPIHEILLKEKERWAIKRAIQLQEKQDNEIRECTFQPKTKTNQDSLPLKISPRTVKHILLY